MSLHHNVRPTWVVPNFALTWSDASCDWAFSPYRRSWDHAAAVALEQGQILAFLFVAPAVQLNRLSLEFTRPEGPLADLWVELSDSVGMVLRRAYVAADALAPAGVQTIMELPGLAFDIGAKYHVRLSAFSEDAAAGLAVTATAQPSTGMAFSRTAQRLRGERSLVYSAPGSVATPNVLVFQRGADLAAVRPALELLAEAFPDEPFTGLYFETVADLWRTVESTSTVVFANFHRASREMGADYDSLCFELYRRGVLTLALDTDTLCPSPLADGAIERATRAAIEDQQRCRFILRNGPQVMLARADQPLTPIVAPRLGLGGALAALRTLVDQTMTPRVAIVSVLYKKADIVEAFLDHIHRQSYRGEIAVVLIDDCSPEPDADIAETYAARLEALGAPNRSVRVLRNEANSGNCQSRMTGIAVQDADIYVVIDCDCLINQDFIASHVFEHANPEVQVVIGALNIESNGRDPGDVVRMLEESPALVALEAEPQDSIQRDGFLNCITRNFSIKREAIPPEGLFDLDFAYSAKPNSGFGWEDVEMGYRLYAGGARIRFTERAFSVHASHPSSASEAAKVTGSMRNFERLFVKHPEMTLAARRWAVDTFDKIVQWADHVGVEPDPVRRNLEARFSATREWQAPLIAAMRGQTRRLRILSYRWHVPHQYELYKLPHDFTLVTGVGENGMINAWSHDQRPLRSNVSFRPISQIDPADYDVAILHFDENVLAPELCNNVIPASWGDPFHWLIGQSLPKVAICHGTPQFVGQYGADSQRKADFVLHEDERARMAARLAEAGVRVVCNSHQALAEWGFSQSQVIWHGFDPQEFPRGKGDLDILALGADPHRPHYRGAWEQLEVEALLATGVRVETARHFGGALEMRGTNAYASSRFRGYAERIGRFKAYLNTTLRSPMPRSRGEAMMTGVVPVCLNNHDVSLFIENGVNGFYSDEPRELADFLNHMCRNDALAGRMAQDARRTALDMFNHDRYMTAWTSLLNEISR